MAQIEKAITIASIVTAVATAVIAAATIFYTVYSQGQWDVAKRQLVSVQRAFVLANKIVAQPIGTPQNGIVRLRVQWENSGNTPTRELATYVNLPLLREAIPRGYNFPDLDNKGKQTQSPLAIHGFIPPHGIIVSTAYLDVPVVSVPDVGSKVRVYSWGWAQYRDIFADTPLHLTRFCFEVTQILIQGTNVSLTAAQCDENNCTDEECVEATRRRQPQS